MTHVTPRTMANYSCTYLSCHLTNRSTFTLRGSASSTCSYQKGEFDANFVCPQKCASTIVWHESLNFPLLAVQSPNSPHCTSVHIFLFPFFHVHYIVVEFRAFAGNCSTDWESRYRCRDSNHYARTPGKAKKNCWHLLFKRIFHSEQYSLNFTQR